MSDDEQDLQTKEEFQSQLQQAMKLTVTLYNSRPDKRDTVGEVELQLDIIQRATAEGRIPTPEDQERIFMWQLAKRDFPNYEQSPPGVGMWRRLDQNTTQEVDTWIQLLFDVQHFYKHFPKD